MLTLALPESVRATISQSLVASYEVAWYGAFEDALQVAPTARAMWLRPSDISAAQGTDLISRAHILSWLHVSRVGVDIFPLAEMAGRDIVLTNGGGLTADAIAEHVVMCMLALRRGLPALLRSQFEASWNPPSARGDRLAGSRALVLGYGHVGTAVVKRAKALGVDVVVARRRPSNDSEVEIAARSWRDLLPNVDFMILALPLTDESRNLIGKSELDRLKPGAVVINVARGEILDTDYLAELVESGRLGGAAIDCFLEEPLPPSSPLWRLPNAIITPHIAWLDSGFAPRELQLFEENAQRFMTGGDLRNVVDLRAGY